LYDTLVETQKAIGWSQLFNGRMSEEWSILQDEYLKSNNIVDHKFTGKQWVATIIATLWNQWFEVWELRNGDVHGRDASTREIAKKNQATRELRALYRVRDQVLAEDGSIFRENAETHLAEFAHSTSIRNWLATNKPHILASIEQAKTQALVGSRLLTSYFQPRAQPTRIRRKFTARKPLKARTKTPHKHRRKTQQRPKGRAVRSASTATGINQSKSHRFRK
jgi:hypothetical protein